MTTLFLRRVGNVLHADGDASLAELSKLPFNKSMKAEIKRPRNSQMHRLYFEICRRIADAVGSETETISDTLKVATGHCTTVKTKRYGILQFPKSISFAAMDQNAFSEFFEKCLAIIWQEWAIDRKDLFEGLEPLISMPESRKRK